MNFIPYQLIEKKRDGKELSDQEIEWFIKGLGNGEVADYQMTAMLMAIYIRGMNDRETAALTRAMLYSGKVLKPLGKNTVDKHSTGGVGDKTSFIVAPLAAACGIKVPMIAGRGLGHTGGTIDKAESIPGFQTNISLDDFEAALESDHLVLTGQTADIAPADRKIYSLRDVTGTVSSIPLITGSILSKKLAEGINGLVMDLKYGTGAFMQNVSDSEELAREMSLVAESFGVNTMMFITDMNQPLGKFAGHSHEIIECIDTLKGQGPKDLEELSLQLAGAMIFLGQKAESFEKGVSKAREALASGRALEVFTKLVEKQGGDIRVIETPYELLPMAKVKTEIKSPVDGFLNSMNNKEVGNMLLQLGGGRKVSSDKIDFAVALEFPKKLGDEIRKDEPVLIIHHHQTQAHLVQELGKSFVNEIITIGKDRVTPPKLVEKVITNIVSK